MIYVLKLINEKYYVGYSTHCDERIKNHFAGKGSSWTKLHHPISIIETFEGGKEEEREITLLYMKKFGWRNVRGAGWTAITCCCPHELQGGASGVAS